VLSASEKTLDVLSASTNQVLVSYLYDIS
jgi:hypothetical protein